jgi:hypothetical protein
MKRILVALLLLAALPVFAKDTLNLYNWNNYIAPETIKRFEEQCKCEVKQTYYSDNEELLAKLAAGAKGYDILVPTSNAVQPLIKGGQLKPIDKAKLTNLKNINPAYMNTPFDPDNKYSVPYAMSTTILGYNAEKMKELGLPTDTWAVIFEPKYLEKVKGRVTVLDSSSELFAAALKYLGYSANDTDEKHWKEAADLIKRAKPYWAAFNASSYIKELTVGNIWLAHGQPRRAGRRAQVPDPAGHAQGRRGAGRRQHGDPQGRAAARPGAAVHELHARRQEFGGTHQSHRLGQSQHRRAQVHQAHAPQERGNLPECRSTSQAGTAAGPDGGATPPARQDVDGDQGFAMTKAARGAQAAGGTDIGPARPTRSMMSRWSKPSPTASSA